MSGKLTKSNQNGPIIDRPNPKNYKQIYNGLNRLQPDFNGVGMGFHYFGSTQPNPGQINPEVLYENT